MNNPVISVIVPCYNQAMYLSETLQSVLEQVFQDWECIIVNDGSSDNTEYIARQWEEKDSRFKYFYKDNGGLSDARNYGIKHALGTYILPLDSDDKIGELYISEAIKVFSTISNVKLVYSNLILFGAENKKLLTSDYQYENLLTENRIFCSGIYRKKDYLKTSGYNPNMKGGLEDWDFWLNLLSPDDVVIKLSDFHFFYRIKDVSMLKSIDNAKNEQLLLQIFRNHVPLFLEYFNPIRDHIEADYYKREVKLYHNSAEYKIGKALLYPFRLLQKIYRRLFS
ncbi:MAG: glycosyltransferase family 2 protein [Dysgonomonas sp.]